MCKVPYATSSDNSRGFNRTAKVRCHIRHICFKSFVNILILRNYGEKVVADEDLQWYAIQYASMAISFLNIIRASAYIDVLGLHRKTMRWTTFIGFFRLFEIVASFIL